MIKKWLKRKENQKQWEMMTTALTNGPATSQVDYRTLEILCTLIKNTMLLYSEKNCITKQTLRLLFLLKRVLADKRQFDTIKTLEYFVAGHTIYKKHFMNKEVKERLVAHCWQMVVLYQGLILTSKASNPFAPGLALGEIHD